MVLWPGRVDLEFSKVDPKEKFAIGQILSLSIFLSISQERERHVCLSLSLYYITLYSLLSLALWTWKITLLIAFMRGGNDDKSQVCTGYPVFGKTSRDNSDIFCIHIYCWMDPQELFGTF